MNIDIVTDIDIETNIAMNIEIETENDKLFYKDKKPLSF
jgi:hypothetical protein